MKKGKELKINLFNDYNIVYGTVDNKNSKALYINISSWAEPLLETDICYLRVIRDINKRIKQNLFNKFKSNPNCLFLAERSIIDLDIRKSGIKFGKKSFTRCEITLFLKNELPLNSDVLRPELDNVAQYIIDTCFKDNSYFKFHRTKK